MGSSFITLFIVLTVTILKTEAAFKTDTEIKITEGLQEVDQSLAVVPGATTCGVTVEDVKLLYACVSSSTDICEVNVDNILQVSQVTFTAGVKVSTLGARIKGKVGGKETTLVDKALDVGIKKGKDYLINIKLSPQQQTEDQTITVTIILYDADDVTSVQLCVKADFKFID